MIVRFMPVLILLLITFVFGLLLTAPEKETTASMAARAAPAITLPTLEGTATSLPTGQWRLVNFFASWCVPCAVEHPNLMELQKTIPITGIAYKDQPVMVRTLLQQRGNPYAQVLMDANGAASIPFGISGVPETFLINPEGKIVWHYAGPLLESQLRDVRGMVR
jgi:cytochrome c biogenesis protein CcmG/thiol:disulfide interchange protein DsbE